MPSWFTAILIHDFSSLSMPLTFFLLSLHVEILYVPTILLHLPWYQPSRDLKTAYFLPCTLLSSIRSCGQKNSHWSFNPLAPSPTPLFSIWCWGRACVLFSWLILAQSWSGTGARGLCPCRMCGSVRVRSIRNRHPFLLLSDCAHLLYHLFSQCWRWCWGYVTWGTQAETGLHKASHVFAS